jgi:hypothetical protein
MFVVEPKRDCPHFISTHLLSQEHWTLTVDRLREPLGEHAVEAFHIDIPSSPCTICSDTSENWICLACKSIACSRYVHGHAKEHSEEYGHALCLSFSDLTIWCHACDSYVVSLLGKPAHRALYFSKFGELSPSEQAGMNEGTGSGDVVCDSMNTPSTPLTPSTPSTSSTPSLESLRQALESVPHAAHTSEGAGIECAICQETVQVGQSVTMLNSCSHRFHRTCLLTWLLRTNECPSCRTPVLESWARTPVVESEYRK